MTHLPVRTRSLDEDPPFVVEGELVDLDALVAPQDLKYPPAVRPRCACGKDGSPKSHGGFTCNEIIAMRLDHENADRRSRLARPWLITGGVVLAGAGVVASVVVLILTINTIVALATTAGSWFATYWPAIVITLVILLLMGGGAKCAGLHCGGCKG